MTKEQEDALLDDPKPAKSYGVNPANTPRTDAATIPCGWDTTDPVVKKTFAQKLEQELNESRIALASMGVIAGNAAEEIEKALNLVNADCPAMDRFTSIIPTVKWLLQKWKECREAWNNTDSLAKKKMQANHRLQDENAKLNIYSQLLRDALASLIYSAEEAAKLIISVTDRYDIDAAIEAAKSVLANKASNRADESVAMQRNWWVNVYPDGRISSALCPSREDALNRCTYTGGFPDAQQVEVRLHIVRLANRELDSKNSV